MNKIKKNILIYILYKISKRIFYKILNRIPDRKIKYIY